MGIAFYRTAAARWTAASGLTALLLFTGCGSDSGSRGSQGNVQPSGLGVSTGKRPSGLFQAVGDGGGPDCSQVTSSEDHYVAAVPAGRRVAEPIEVERLHSIFVCFLAFTHTIEPIEVELTGPDGNRVVQEADPKYGWYVNERLDMKRGNYWYRAAPKLAGSSSVDQVTGVITVVPAREPRVHKISDTAPSGGQGLQIALVGYPPGSLVQAFLYGFKDDPLPFVRALPQASIGSDGEAVYTWEARGDDPPGTYAIWFNPGGPTSGSPTGI